MKKAARADLPVSPNNPCPFLRALVAAGKVADGQEPLFSLSAAVVQAASGGAGAPALPAAAIYGIALIANGLAPWTLLQTQQQGLKLNALRGGPLDKKGAGSGILNTHAEVNATQLARLGEFAKNKKNDNGRSEPGLGLRELRTFMDANFERAAGRRRLVDRALMNGEWPVLLKVMGKDGPDGRYLSVKEVTDLFKKRQLPARMNDS